MKYLLLKLKLRFPKKFHHIDSTKSLHKYNGIMTKTPRDHEVKSTHSGNVICKMEPYNMCYRLDQEGNMVLVKDNRPFRVLRIYS